jgi:small subunit ribosomal protein S16
MATKIRFSRRGTTKRPFYWLVVTNSRSPRDGKFLEKLGTYNPLLAKDNAERTVFKNERIEYWLSTGAQASDRALKLFQAAGVKLPAKKAAPAKKTTAKAEKPAAKATKKKAASAS